MTTAQPKRKISISLDADVVDELGAEGPSLSAQVNAALRDELERRQRGRLLDALLDELDALHGAVDPALVRKYEEILG